MTSLRSNGMRAWYLPEATLRHFVPVEKCTLKHIAHRMETYGYFVAWERCSFSDYTGTPMLFGIPAWMYRKSFELLQEWCSAKINKQKAYREYLEWRRFLGTMLAVRDVIASKKTLKGIQTPISKNLEPACRSIDRLHRS